MFYYFLFVRIKRSSGKTLFCVFVNFALFWRFATLERYYAEKMMMHICFIPWKLTVSLISLSVKRHLQFSVFHPVTQGLILSLPWCALLCSHCLHLYLSWLSLWHSTMEKGSNSHPKFNHCHHLCSLMPEAFRFTPSGWFWRLRRCQKAGQRFQLNALNMLTSAPSHVLIISLNHAGTMVSLSVKWMYLHLPKT